MGVQVRIASEIHRKLRYLAAQDNVQVSDVTNRLLESVVDVAFKKMAESYFKPEIGDHSDDGS